LHRSTTELHWWALKSPGSRDFSDTTGLETQPVNKVMTNAMAENDLTNTSFFMSCPLVLFDSFEKRHPRGSPWLQALMCRLRMTSANRATQRSDDTGAYREFGLGCEQAHLLL